MQKTKAYYAIHAILVLLFCAVSLNLKGQAIGLSTGVGYSSFFDLKKNTTHKYAHYTKGSHQFIRLDLDSYLPEANFLSIHIQLDRSKGSIKIEDFPILRCGLFTSASLPPVIDSQITIYRMSVGVMPINLKIVKNIRFKAGASLSKVFKTIYADRKDEFQDLNNGFTFGRQKNEDAVKEFGLGLLFELQLGSFKLGDDLLINPVYNSSISLTEDINSNFYTRTLRQSLGIAIKWNMKPKLIII